MTSLREIATLLGLPREVRDMILVHWLPQYEDVRLTRLPAPYKRRHWMLREKRRYDPRVLSVCKQLYEEASEMLYNWNFVVDVNCGDGEWNETTLPGTDWRWCGTNLTGRFPFHKARQLTFRIDINTCHDPDHLFYHMVHICDFLLSEVIYLENLRIEISNSLTHTSCLDVYCLSWQNTDSVGTAATFNVEQTDGPTDLDHPDYASGSESAMVDYVAFLLRPLALPGRVQNCKINVLENVPMTPSLKKLLLHYEDALTDKRPFGYKETKSLWDHYLSILNERAESERNQRQLDAENHDVWLVNTHQLYKCKHPSRAAKKYSRHCGKDAECDGCQRWFHFLMECRKCSVRACTSCMSSLRKELSPFQKEKLHEAWLLTTSSQNDCKHQAKATKRYCRPCGKDAQCDGCQGEFHWLMACASCMKELRKKRLALQEKARMEGSARGDQEWVGPIDC
ncbi:MAG: hypothetical protein Q9221_001014 [Calogaya cf. arnoldii]